MASEVVGSSFDCESVSGQQSANRSETSRRMMLISVALAFGASSMVGFFVVGPMSKYAMSSADVMDHGHGLYRAGPKFFAPSMPMSEPLSTFAASRKGSYPGVALGSTISPVVTDATRLIGRCGVRASSPAMSLGLDLKGKVAFVAGVGDSTGYGWAICKAFADAGATIIVGTWPPVLGIFEKSLKAGKFDKDMILSDGSKMNIDKIYPLDAVYDEPDQVPDDVKNNKRYGGLDGYTITEVAAKVANDYGKIDILVHSLANGPEVTKPLLETSRSGYLAASSASAYSMVSLVQNFAPIMNPGGSVLSLSYLASEKVIPGYGGGMSSAKAQLESDTRVLAYEAGQKYNIRVNTISAGPFKSRAAAAISKGGPKPFIEVAIDYCRENAPLKKDLTTDDVGQTAAFLASPLAGAITGVTMYVDNGMHAMGMVQNVAVEQVKE